MASYQSGPSRDPFGKAEAPMSLSDQQQENQPPSHKRVYQACIPCRRRKVRCDLGSVDNPHEPPCVRCRRESKHCFFSATRRKRKNDDGIDALSDGEDDYIQRNGRKRHQPSGSPSVDRNLFSDVPLTPGGHVGRSQPLRPPFETSSSRDNTHRGVGDLGGVEGEPNTPMENLEARTVMRREVYGPHDALELLYKAATDGPHRENGVDVSNRPVSHNRQNSLMSPQERVPNSLPQQSGNGMFHESIPPVDPQIEQSIDPELTAPDLTDEPGHAEALKVWARFRFVRAGWFTAQEAIEFIDYYYTYLSPLTPVSPPTFKSPASHVTLLTEEPILTVTLLTIASRYRTLTGPGGHCRSHAIHEKLWDYLRGMIERVVWGQEAFGGGFCGSGADATQTSSTAPWRGLRKGSLRTLGTIESLMILTEWHPRALHFPPAEATDELLLPAYEEVQDVAGNNRPTAGVGSKRIESWLEPAWRSDRMCWMLLSTAMGLAYELGVFDDIDELLAENKITRPEYEDEPYRLRASRIKKLLLIYMTQLAGRLGWTNMVPENLRKSDTTSSRKRNNTAAGIEGTTPGTNPSSLSTGFNYVPDLDLDDRIIFCWAGISNAMHTGNQKLFRSRQHTTDIIQSGAYTGLLREFHPILSDWKKDFDNMGLPEYIRHILLIEYEYVRIYVNSLSLQAVVERSTNNAEKMTASNSNAQGQLSPQTQNYLGKLPLSQLGGFFAEDKQYVREVVMASRNMLKTVVDGLLPKGYLKHAPVRTYFRIISGAMFLLKTFALGAPRVEVEESIVLVDRCVAALRGCVVDDVHLGKRFADLLESLTSRLRTKFIQAPQPLPGSHQAQSVDGRSPAPHQGEPASAVNGSHLAVELMHLGNKQERSSTPANVSATPFDPSNGVFPYPTGSASMFGPSTPANNGGMDNGMAFDNLYSEAPSNYVDDFWYLPTGNAFFGHATGDGNVAMTAEGINIGGTDMLDFMVDAGNGNGTYGAPGGGYS